MAKAKKQAKRTGFPRLRAGETLWTMREVRGEWRWRSQAANYRIDGASEEGRKNRAAAARNAAKKGGPAELVTFDRVVVRADGSVLTSSIV